MQDPPIMEDELQRYVDGVLPEDRRAGIAAWLAANPEESARVRQLQALNALLHSHFDTALTEPVPERLTRELARGPARMRLAIAASIVALGVGALAGWAAHAWTDRNTGSVAAARGKPPGLASAWPRQAILAHVAFAPEVRHPVEVAASDEAHLIAWLSKRLGTPLRPASLTAQGYDLMGGRLLPGDSAPTAQFMYQNANGKRLTLMVARKPDSSADTAFKFMDERGVAMFYWIDGPFGYALSGELPRNELMTIASAVYKQLNP
jgi:anti-sigma factor RsiW